MCGRKYKRDKDILWDSILQLTIIMLTNIPKALKKVQIIFSFTKQIFKH